MHRTPSLAPLVIVVLLSGISIGRAATLFVPSSAQAYLPAVSQSANQAPIGINTAATESLMLGASDFAFKSDDIPIFGGPQPTVAQLHLPQGAQVIRVTVYYSRPQPLPFTTDVFLQRQQFDTFETLAAFTIAGTGPVGRQTQDTTIPGVGAVIDNTMYGYRIALSANTLSNIDEGYITAYQVRVDYQLPQHVSPGSTATATPTQIPPATLTPVYPTATFIDSIPTPSASSQPSATATGAVLPSRTSP